MQWRDCLVGLGISVLFHLLVFWPAPEVKLGAVKVVPFSVSFAPSLPVKPASEDVPVLDCCGGSGEPRLLGGGDLAASVRHGSPVSGKREKKVARLSVEAVEHVVPDPEVSTSLAGDVPVANVGQAVQGASLARYRLALAAAAVRMQRYPRAVMEAGREGTVIVEVQVTAVQRVPLVRLGHSSGVGELDGEALALLERAVRTVPVMPGQEFVIRLPVRFDLQGE